MARIRPFKALRPKPQYAREVAALPYDVQSVEEARAIVAENPHSFLAIDEPVVNFPEGTDPFDLLVYLKAGSMMRDLKTRGILAVDDAPAFYLYELTMDGRTQTGLVGCVAIDDYLDGVVKEHESTRVDKEVDRINHVRGCEAQTGPIFLAHHPSNALPALYEQAKASEPIFDFTTDDGVRHRGFKVPEELNNRIAQTVEDLGRIYIADGHHRIAAAAEVAKARRVARGCSIPTEESDWFLAVLFGADELKIWPYERVVHDLNGLGTEDFLEALRERFSVAPIREGGQPVRILDAEGPEEAARSEELIKPRCLGEFCVLVDGCWYRCHMDPATIPDDPYDGLEVSLLQHRLFEPVLGIADPRRSPRIDFVGGIRGLAELERRCEDDCAAAFALSPTAISELFAVADAGLLMPPKSTWFEPKLRSGLFIHEI